MANSLLAHLYSHIRGSQEDIATISLQYILSQSFELNRAFTNFISDVLNIKLTETIQYTCQQSGKNKERPDLSGINQYGKEVILCEMKFYASLTSNQPLAYIDRLQNEQGKGLIFICPKARKTSLWSKLNELIKERDVAFISDECVSVDKIHMGITTWDEIISVLNKVAVAVSKSSISDIQQLEGYCAQMDSDAFIPFDAEDLSGEVARKEERYYQVLDEVIELLKAEKVIKASTNKLKATAHRHGYTRAMYIDNLTITLNYDRNMWKSSSSVETPFWISFRNCEWEQTTDILKKYSYFDENKKENILWGMQWIALEPLMNATLDEVAEDMKNQILEIYNKIK